MQTQILDVAGKIQCRNFIGASWSINFRLVDRKRLKETNVFSIAWSLTAKTATAAVCGEEGQAGKVDHESRKN